MMTLRRAAEWCGGIDALGDALNATADRLERWLSGEEEVPSAVFEQGVALFDYALKSQRADARRIADALRSSWSGLPVARE